MNCGRYDHNRILAPKRILQKINVHMKGTHQISFTVINNILASILHRMTIYWTITPTYLNRDYSHLIPKTPWTRIITISSHVSRMTSWTHYRRQPFSEWLENAPGSTLFTASKPRYAPHSISLHCQPTLVLCQKNVSRYVYCLFTRSAYKISTYMSLSRRSFFCIFHLCHYVFAVSACRVNMDIDLHRRVHSINIIIY